MQLLPTAPEPCSLCGNNTGPFTLTDKMYIQFVTPNAAGTGPKTSAVIICQGCARDIARINGFSQGKKLEELKAAADQIREWEKEIGNIRETNSKLVEQTEAFRRHASELTSERDQLLGRVHQLEARLKERAESDLALAQ